MGTKLQDDEDDDDDDNNNNLLLLERYLQRQINNALESMSLGFVKVLK